MVGAAVIGIVSGILVVVAVEFIDQKLHIDDPVGAVAVHCANGIWGTIAEGLFNTSEGLFYGGGFAHLGIQCLGVVSIGGYTVVVMFLVYKFIDATVGLRVSKEDEMVGLDIAEHGLTSAYADFLPVAPGYGSGSESSGPVDVTGLEPVTLTETAPAVAAEQPKLTRVSIICKEERFAVLRDTMAAIGVTGMTVSSVMGCGTQLY